MTVAAHAIRSGGRCYVALVEYRGKLRNGL